MSDDGRYIIFESKATDLITGQSDIPDTNDLFWKDLQTGGKRAHLEQSMNWSRRFASA